MAKTTRACSICKRRLGVSSFTDRQWKLDSLSRKCEDCCPVNKQKPKAEDYDTTLRRVTATSNEKSEVVKRQVNKRSQQEVICGLAQAIQCGLDINRPNKTGLTVLMAAARSGDSEIVDWLLANCPEIDLDGKSPQGETAIMMAARVNKPTLVLALASRGADVTGVEGHDGILTCGTEMYMLTLFEAMLGPHSALKRLLPIPPLVAICVDYLDTRSCETWEKEKEEDAQAPLRSHAERQDLAQVTAMRRGLKGEKRIRQPLLGWPKALSFRSPRLSTAAQPRGSLANKKPCLSISEELQGIFH